MITTHAGRYADQIEVGDRIPELIYPVTATTVVQGAAASGDWQPQHHDHAWARRVGTQDIFLNTPTQGGWICRYVTDWAGPKTRFGRIAYRMRASIYPGDALRFEGEVVSRFEEDGLGWIQLKVSLRVGETANTVAEVLFALPRAEGAVSPWAFGPSEWRVPPMPAE